MRLFEGLRAGAEHWLANDFIGERAMTVVTQPIEEQKGGRQRAVDIESVLPVFNKSSGSIIESLPIDNVEAVQHAAEKAKAAQLAWAAIGVRERAKRLKRARREIVLSRTKIMDALAAETGKAPFDVVGEIFSVCQDIGLLAKKAPGWLKSQRVSTKPLFGKRGKIVYKPYGLVGVISPWNAPLTLALGDVLPALIAGNAVIVKPSEITPLAVKYTVDALNRVLPEGILQVLIGHGDTGAALVDEVDMVAVTGSCQTGMRVMERASQRLTPVLLELGGKDPMIILADADLDRAARAAAWGSTFMTGQVCMSIERIYVDRTVSEAFKEKLLEQIERLRTGPDVARDNMDFGPFIGPLQVDIVEAQIEDAKRLGANIVCGGQRLESPEVADNPKKGVGVYFEPTVVFNVDHTMKLMKEETFGPVVSVMEVDDVEQALVLANDSQFGLSASIWTKNIEQGIAIAQRLQAGNVCVNDCILNAGVPALPFGGSKKSGVGARHGGATGLRQFCQIQSLMIEARSRKSEMAWFPYRPETARKLEKLMTLMYRW